MRLLLDTQALIWTLVAPTRLSAAAAEAIRSPDTSVYVSVASPWEIAIKKAQGKLSPPNDLGDRLDEMRFDLLPVSLQHTYAVASLPHHHGDPFDRMLVAQAQVEGLTIVTSDRQIPRYQVAVLPAR